ncbi:2TM domain-containing protein [bacterium]|nr:2TM domain-containing protein [bacterium]
MENSAKYERARKRVEELKEFYTHLLTYVIVNAFLIVLNLMTSPGYYWVKWPLLGWGLGLAIHAGTVFIPGACWGRAWEERKIKELVEKDQGD